MSHLSITFADAVASEPTDTGTPDAMRVNQESLLLSRFIGGDDSAFVLLYDRYNPHLYLYCRKMVGSAQLAQDMMQEVWIRVIGLRARPQTISNPGGFLLTMARNLCLNHIKSRERLAPFDRITEEDHPTFSLRELSEMEEMVLLALPKLPFDLREILVLNVYCDYSAEQIAVMLGLAPNAVRTRACRARARLKKMIERMIDYERRQEGLNETETAG